MANVVSPIFGTLDPSAPGFWLASVAFEGHAVEFDLTIEGFGMTAANLNRLPQTLDELTLLDRAARLTIVDDAKRGDEDSATAVYVKHYYGELSADEYQRLFGTNSSDLCDAETIFSRMRLIRVGLYPEHEKHQILLDYSIDPNATRYLLCVSFDPNRQPSSVDLES